jgi:FHA domain
MPTCPAGHSSGADDYCDVCGTRLAGGGPPGSVPSGSGFGAGSAPPAPAPGGDMCPDCSAPRTGRFCEGCGYDFAIGAGRPSTAGPVGTPPAAPPPPPQPAPVPDELMEDQATGRWRDRTAPSTPAPPRTPTTTWTAVVTADRDYYETVLRQADGDAGFAFPPYCPERRIPLDRPQVRIGRRSVSQGTAPEIDLGEPPEDPGASHTHAVLLAKPDGTWTLVDPGSTNGTTMNGGEEPIPVNVEVPVNDGDRIHVGVWTTITLRRG